MTTPFPVTKTGLSAAMAGLIAMALFAGPVRAEDKVLAKVNGSEIRQSDVPNRLLMDSLLASEGKAATTNDAMKKVYEEASKQITGEQEVHARHILVETEDEAKAIAAELKKGADFAELREAAKVERMDKPAEAAKTDAPKPDAAKPADSKMAPPAKK